MGMLGSEPLDVKAIFLLCAVETSLNRDPDLRRIPALAHGAPEATIPLENINVRDYRKRRQAAQSI
jgi:hypothetical protein